MFALGLLGIALVSFFVWISRTSTQLDKERKEKQERQAKHEAWERRWEERRNAYYSAKATALAEMVAQWGECTKDIYVDYSDTFTLEDRVWVFEKAEKIVIGGNTYDFEDIIGFSLLNKSETIYNAYTTGKSQKNLGSMVAQDEVENDFKIYVNVNSISSPTVFLNIGSNEDDAYEISNLLNVIIARNKKSE